MTGRGWQRSTRASLPLGAGGIRVHRDAGLALFVVVVDGAGGHSRGDPVADRSRMDLVGRLWGQEYALGNVTPDGSIAPKPTLRLS